MKFSERWLREWVDTDLTTEQLLESMSDAGLEVDAVTPVAADFNHVVIGQVLEVERHPDADRLTVCQVTVGDTEPLTIVCGAKNVAAEMKVPVAMIGAQLGDLKIKKSKLRGVASHGMLCSAKELGLAEESSGILALPIDAPLGEDIRQWLQLDDRSIDLDLTPNRGDCLGIAGIARDVAALSRGEYRTPSIEPVAAQTNTTLPVELIDSKGCSQYAGRVIRGIDATAVSPLWLQERLRRSGLRSIHPVVDVTNYVMLELGQPMHAFDLARIDKKIIVRRAKPQEKLTLLDERELTLREDSLVIADETKALALAGIMGGLDSAVTTQTRDIFLESAYFSLTDIAGQARSYQLSTDSSHRFERGVSPALQVLAIERATQLLLDIVGGQPGPVIQETISEALPTKKQVRFRPARANALLGLSIEAAQMSDILQRLGMDVTKSDDNTWQVTVPSYRFDVSIEADLIEEIARVYGYQRLPVSHTHAQLAAHAPAESMILLATIKQVLVDLGYQESINYSFVNPELQQRLLPQAKAIDLANPLAAELSQMRVSLWPGLLTSLRYNQYRQQHSVRLFETGLTFTQTEEGLTQLNTLAGLIAGHVEQDSWQTDARDYDFFDIKGDITRLLQLTRDTARYVIERGEHPALHPGQCASITVDGQVIGYFGALHPNLVQELELTGPVFLFELSLAQVQQRALPEYRPLSKFPEVERDLSFIVDDAVSAQAVIDAVWSSEQPWLQTVRIFDVYQGKDFAPGTKSVAIKLTFQHAQRTLSDEDIDGAVTRIIDSLINQLHIQLRD
jgi:phenylalanyl-tRNA synthetase beta chain